jgi:hypothetical protein
MRTRVWVCGTAAVLLAAGTAAAQEEKLAAGTLKSTQATVVRASPKTGGTALRRIPAGSELTWVEGQKKGNFYRVVVPKGPVGWVPVGAVDVVEKPPAAAIGLEAAAPPCAANLSACEVQGCGAAGSTQAVGNMAKRREPGSGPAVLLTFADFSALQEQADTLVGQAQELTQEERATLKDMTVSPGKVSEGDLVRMAAFIATGPAPHANTGESVNCRLKGPANNDFHINVAENASEDAFDGVVVEMIPQERPAAWTLAKLKTTQTKRQQVLIEGNLLYDNKHVVNSDRDNPLGGQPARFSLWEIHRVTRFWICPKAGGGCDPAKEEEWTELK